LMWASAILAILAALSTGLRYYIDRRAGELSSSAQKVAAFEQQQEQLGREAALKKQVEDAKREQEAAAAKLLAVEAMARVRRLTPEQREQLTSSARQMSSTIPKIEVTAANSNQEAQAYALDFVKSLQAAGCPSDLSLPVPGLTPDVTGIHIAVRDVGAIPVGATELAKLLSELQIPFSFSSMKPDFFPGSPFILVVGAKQP